MKDYAVINAHCAVKTELYDDPSNHPLFSDTLMTLYYMNTTTFQRHCFTKEPCDRPNYGWINTCRKDVDPVCNATKKPFD